jgi:enoyl-CoA hydratase/carnithine racemase
MDQLSSECVPVTGACSDGILRLILRNLPANLLSVSTIERLQEKLDIARDDPSVRVVVLSAEGTLFSAGHDLREMTAHRRDGDGGRAFFEHVFALCARLMESIVELPKPVIAEVDGVATAAGCQLVATCDLVIASDQASFGVNGIDVGLFCSTPAVALTRAVTAKRAMEMLLTGEMISARTALAFGLVNRVVPREALRTTVDEVAKVIAAKSPTAVRLGKQAVRAQFGMSVADAYAHTSRVMVENLLVEDAEEGIRAFLEKRAPKWREGSGV